MGNVIGQAAQEPVDVPMVALCDHIGFNYNNRASVMVHKGDKFFTTQGRAIRLVEKGTAALDLGDYSEADEFETDELAPVISKPSIKIDKRSKAYRKGR